MNSYGNTRDGRSTALAANKKEKVELGKKEHGLNVGRHIAESNFRHGALDMIRRHQHLQGMRRSHYAMDADDEAEISESESQKIALSVGNRRQSGLRELSMRESASLKPVKKKKNVRSKLFDYEQSQGRSRRRMLGHQNEDPYTYGAGSVPNIHNVGTANGGSAARNLNETGSSAAIRRQSLADESHRRYSFGADSERQHSSRGVRPDTLTRHEYAMHLLTSDHRKQNQNNSHRVQLNGTSGSKSSSDSWFESSTETLPRRHSLNWNPTGEYQGSSSSHARKNSSTDPGLSSRIASDSESSPSSHSSFISMDGRHDKLLKNGNSNHIRKNLGVGAKSSKPHDEPEGSLGQAENGKHSWAPIIPSQLASSNQKFADLSHCRPSESVKVEQLREKRHRSGRTSHKAAEAHHVSLTAEAMEEFRELIRDPSFCLRFECIPDVVGPVCSRDYKTRRRMMALELLLKQMPTIKKQIQDQDATFDPYEMLSCTYLRLSSNNIKTLVEMCREAGLDVDYHPHMDESDPKLSLTGSVIASSAIPQRVSSPEGVKTSPPTEQQNLRECFPNAD